MAKIKKGLLTILIIALLVLLIYYFKNLLTLENFKTYKDIISHFVENNYFSSVILYVLFYIFTVSLSLPGAAILSVAGGFLFNIIPGVLYIIIAATIGAFLSFLFFRYISNNFEQLKHSESYKKFNNNFAKHGPLYILLLRLIPIVPFFLVNILSAVTSISLNNFAVTTFFGIIPGSFMYAFAGKEINKINSLNDIFSFKILISVTALTLFVLLLFFAGKKLTKFKI